MRTRSQPTEMEQRLAPVTELLDPIRSILEQIAPAVRGGEYAVIVVDDTSGRVPGMIVHWAIDRYRANHGLAKLPVVFLPGGAGREYKTADADAYFARSADHIRRVAGLEGSPEKAPRALLITDNIQTGNTVAFTARNLNSIGLAVDIASVGAHRVFNPARRAAYEANALAAGTRLYLGAERWTYIDGRHDISGVAKFVPHPVITDFATRQVAVRARELGWEIGRMLAPSLEAGMTQQPGGWHPLRAARAALAARKGRAL